MTKKKVISAAEFKAVCLSLMDEVSAKGMRVLITKRGKPIAQLVPIEEASEEPLFGSMKGSLRINGDIVVPLDVSWNAGE